MNVVIVIGYPQSANIDQDSSVWAGYHLEILKFDMITVKNNMFCQNERIFDTAPDSM